MDCKSRSRDWAMLSNLVLDLIFQKLPSISDCLRFSLVCKSWFSFVSNNYDALQQRIKSSSIEELPLLMIFTDNHLSITYASLYNAAKNKIVLHLQLPLPNEPSRCCGSSHGWLAFQQRRLRSVFLFNPFSGETIHLPNLKIYIDKITLSKNPSTNPHDFEVVAICRNLETGDKLAILKPGKETWSFSLFRGPRPCDVIYYNERYYVVDCGGSILSTDSTNVRYETAPQPFLYSEFYLVKTTTNELLRVERTSPLCRPHSSVRISKLVTCPTTQESMFVNVDNLGDEALFVCHHGATSVSASKFSGCKANSIYYMDRLYTQSYYKDMTYFVENIHLQDRSTHDHFSFYANVYMAPRALWLIPTPKFTTSQTWFAYTYS